MHQDLVDRDPLSLVHLQHPRQEVLRQAGHVPEAGVVEIELAPDDEQRNALGRWRLRHEREGSRQHNVKQDPSAPYVCCY